MLKPETPILELSTVQVENLLLKVAQGATADRNVSHPGDISSAMAFAVEYAAETLTAMRNMGLLKWEGLL